MDLIKINLTYTSSVSELNSIFPGTAKKVKQITDKKMKELSKLALQACQSKVPQFTKQLRNTQIKSKFVSNLLGSQAYIYVVDEPHTNSNGRRKPSASKLALTLDEGIENGIVLHRRKNALPANALFSSPSKGSLTAGWIGEANKDFGSILPGALNGK